MKARIAVKIVKNVNAKINYCENISKALKINTVYAEKQLRQAYGIFQNTPDRCQICGKKVRNYHRCKSCNEDFTNYLTELKH
jgi:hypothetical protein